MLKAYPKIGTASPVYTVHADRSSETYRRRTDFGRVGAEWDGYHWIVTEEQRRRLGIEKMVRVRTEPCHMPYDTTYVRERDAVVGQSVSFFCGLCDSRTSKRILDILPS